MLPVLILAVVVSASSEYAGSAADRFSTHDGESRVVPDVQGKCSSDFDIVEIVFIALPGNGSDAIELIIAPPQTISLRGATKSFGEFGYNLSLSTGVSFTSGDNLTIYHPDLERSHFRLLHQIGNESRKICWSKIDNPDQITCPYDHDYPLLAIETEPEGCIEGLMNPSELRRVWKNRDSPVLYSSPEIHLVLCCSGLLTQILAGMYAIPGDPDVDVVVQIVTNSSFILCNLSPSVTHCVKMYDCTNLWVNENDSLKVYQRYSTSQIGFIHDEGMDIPLLSLNISGECSSSHFVSEEVLINRTNELHQMRGPCIQLSPAMSSMAPPPYWNGTTTIKDASSSDNLPSHTNVPPTMCNSNQTDNSSLLVGELIVVVAFIGMAGALFLMITANLICCVVCLARWRRRKKRGRQSAILVEDTTNNIRASNTTPINTPDDSETLPISGDSVVDISTSTNEAYLASGDITVGSNPAYEPLQIGTSEPEESLVSYSYVYAEAI